MNEIEKSWNEEVKEKKRTASGVHGKKGKRGYVGTMRTPVDLMTPKERRGYTSPSEVTTSSIYDKIMSLDDFKALSRQKKMLALDAYKKRYKVSEIASEWNLSHASIYNYFRSYLTAPAQTEQAPATHCSTTEELSGKQASSASPENECYFTLTGNYEAQSLARKLTGLAYMLDDQLRYQVEIRVKEID